MEISMSVVYLLLAAGLLVIGAYAALKVQRWSDQRRMRARFRKGRVGEASALALLEREGFEILDDQATRESGLWVDDQWVAVTVRADYLAQRAGERFVVEVKTGQSAPNPASRATRRQLLEYSLVYDVDGVILADMEAERLVRIRFPRAAPNARPPRRSSLPYALLAGTLAAGLLIGVFLGVRATNDRQAPAAAVPAESP
ncbi:MAG: hypothetical protein KDA42_04390 [Planctomycetales bacterium]|nr:hypothetical protein [Planctomycetales bacterium]